VSVSLCVSQCFSLSLSLCSIQSTESTRQSYFDELSPMLILGTDGRKHSAPEKCLMRHSTLMVLVCQLDGTHKTWACTNTLGVWRSLNSEFQEKRMFCSYYHNHWFDASVTDHDQRRIHSRFNYASVSLSGGKPSPSFCHGFRMTVVGPSFYWSSLC
jgi:hypothetical protein